MNGCAGAQKRPTVENTGDVDKSQIAHRRPPAVAAASALKGLAVAVAEALNSEIGDPLIAVIRECPDH